MTCEAVSKPTCMDGQHKIYDSSKDAEEIQVELNQVLEKLYKSSEMRDKMDKELQAKMAENNDRRQKIRDSILSCLEMSYLSPAIKLLPAVRKKIIEASREATNEVEQAQQLNTYISTPHSEVHNLSFFYIIRDIINSLLKSCFFLSRRKLCKCRLTKVAAITIL